MADTIDLRMDSEVIGLSLLVNSLKDVSDLLAEVATDAVGQGVVSWAVTTLSKNSPALVALHPVTRDDTDAERVTALLNSGLTSLQAPNSAWPQQFSERALEKIGSLARRSSDDVRIQVGRHGSLADLDSTVAANVTRLLAPSSVALGTVEGSLESVTVHKSPEFSVYSHLDRRRVRCHFGSRVGLDELRHAIGRRVAVYGVMRVRDDGAVVSITAESLDVLPEEAELPPYQQARGAFGGVTQDG